MNPARDEDAVETTSFCWTESTFAPKTTASRFTAGVACLLGCEYHGQVRGTNSDKSFQKSEFVRHNAMSNFIQ